MVLCGPVRRRRTSGMAVNADALAGKPAVETRLGQAGQRLTTRCEEARDSKGRVQLPQPCRHTFFSARGRQKMCMSLSMKMGTARGMASNLLRLTALRVQPWQWVAGI